MSDLRKILSILIILGFSFLLNACCLTQALHKRETQYLCYNEAPPLQVPPCVNRQNIGSDYAIPPVSAPKPCEPVCILPPR